MAGRFAIAAMVAAVLVIDPSGGASASPGAGVVTDSSVNIQPLIGGSRSPLTASIDNAALALSFAPCTTATPIVTTAADLDDAIGCYNAQTPAGNHTITFGADITHSGATPTITQNDPNQTLFISGTEHILTGPGADTIAGEVDLFTVNGAGPVTFDDLTISAADYTAIRVLGGTVVIGSTRVEDNGWNGVFVGGGGVTIANSTITNNAYDFGVRVEGGSITLVNSVITDNNHGLYLLTASVTVTNSTIANNDIGVFVISGSMTISNSTITNNTDLGVRAYAGSVAISNSTISNNTGEGVSAYGGSVAISNSTIAANSTGIIVNSGSARVASSIVAANTVGDCSGTIVDGGNNFAGGLACIGSTSLSPGSLGVLGDNGCGAPTPFGCVSTVPLLAGSNAVGAGVCSGVVVGADPAGGSNFVTGDLVTDQRGVGFPRTIGPACDAGAFEPDPCPNPTSTPTVTTAAELDRAITCYNNQQAAGDHTITFGADITHTGGTPWVSQPDAMSSLIIDGAGHILTGPGANTIPGNVDLITVGGSGPVTVHDLTISAADFAAIKVHFGTVTITDTTVTNSQFGMALFGGSVSVSNSTITNSSDSGVVVAGGSASISNSTFSNNLNAGVSVEGGSASISNSTITNGSVGLVASRPSSISISNSTITNSRYGVYAFGGASISISNSTITNSSIFGVNNSSGSVRMVSSIVSESSNRDCLASSPIVDGGNNFAGVAGSCPAGFGTLSAGSLGVLADNGCATPTPSGCVQTRALLAGSNAIDAGVCAGVVVGADPAGGSNFVTGDLTADQRGAGYQRTVGPACDAGAFEFNLCPNPTSTPMVTTAAELDRSITCFNIQQPPGDHTITFAADITHAGGTPTVNQPDSTKSVIIDGAGHTLTGPGRNSVPNEVNLFTFSSEGQITVDNLTVEAADWASVRVFSGTVTIANTTLTNVGIGAKVDHGAVTISNTTITNTDYAIQVGGGSATTISNSTIANNSYGVDAPNGSVAISNSTITNNAEWGIVISGASVSIANTTITGNGTGVLMLRGPVFVVSSVIHGNSTSDCSGTIIDLGKNFAGGGGSCPAGFATLSTGSLGVLADNGCATPTSTGCVRTQALLAGSNAIGGGLCSSVVVEADPAGGSNFMATGHLTTDQRGIGYPRTVGLACDAGAFERDVCTTATPTVTTQQALDDAIACYNAQRPVGDHTITFGADITHSSGTSTIVQSDSTKSLTIDGAGHTLAGPISSQLLAGLIRVDAAGPVALTRLTITADDQDGVQVISGTLTIANAAITGTGVGWGVYVTGGSMSLSSSTVSNQFAGVSVTAGVVSITNSDIRDNGLILEGAGVVVQGGSVSISNSTVGGNLDGLAISGGSVSISNSTVVGNSSAGVNVVNGSVTVSNTTVSANGSYGVSRSGGSLSVVSSIVAGNTIAACSGAVVDDGNNFTGDPSCAGFTALSVWPFGGLGDNGCAVPTPSGCVQTIPLLAGSNAIGGGECTNVVIGADPLGGSAFVTGDLETDQRGIGFPRTVGLRCDAGAFESDVVGGAGFVALAPARIVDSRPEYPVAGANNRFTTPWGEGVTRTVTVTGVGGVPATGVTAVAIHVTSVAPSANSFLTVWADGTRPLAASKNFGITAGGPYGYAALTNDLLIVPVSAGGTIKVYNDAGTVHLVFDVVGYYSTSQGATFTELPPARIIDSRPEYPVAGPNNVFTTPWGQGATRTVTVTGVGGVPATGVTAVAIHVTSVAPSANSFLTVWADGTRPLAASKNFGITAGGPYGYAALTNDLLIVPVSPTGTIEVYNDAGTVHLVFDVVGYYSTSQGATFTELPPARIIDSRPEYPVAGPNNVFTTPWGQGAIRTVTVTGVGGVPATGVTAVAIHVTSVAPSANSFLTVWADGTRPLAASKNYGITAGGPYGYAALTNDLLIVPVSPTGTIEVYNDAGTVHLVFDVIGYYG